MSLEPQAESSVAASYRWYFNGNQPISASNATARLDLTRVQYSNSGAYTLVVTNYFGVVTSAVAQLNVIKVVARRPAPCLTVQGEPGRPLALECLDAIATNSKWTRLSTLTLTSSPAHVSDPTLELPSTRFYRVSQVDPVEPPPFLNLEFVPAITLTGTPGDQQRVDFINAIGPIDAWCWLATVTLTNSTQLFFDTSARDQPRRLYRVMPLP